jgi:hypothetical protein
VGGREKHTEFFGTHGKLDVIPNAMGSQWQLSIVDASNMLNE